MFKKKIDTQEKMVELITNRWSGRACDDKKPVAHHHIISLLDAARWGQACFVA